MLEANTNRLLMVIAGVVIAGGMFLLFFGDMSADPDSEDSSGFLNNTTEQLIEQNQHRTPKY